MIATDLFPRSQLKAWKAFLADPTSPEAFVTKALGNLSGEEDVLAMFNGWIRHFGAWGAPNGIVLACYIMGVNPVKNKGRYFFQLSHNKCLIIVF